ncbi:MAG: TolC family protein [Bdellovibrionales bacterium]
MFKLFSRSSIVVVFFGYCINLNAQANGSQITLDEYLSQVAGKNGAYKGAEIGEEAASLREEEWSLITSPSLFGGAQRFKDEREVSSPRFQGSETTVDTYSLGVNQQTNFGLAAKLSYVYNDTTIKGADTTFLPDPHFLTAGPYLELTQALGRNGFGGEIRASQRLQEAQAKAAKHLSGFKRTTIGAEAESLYWRLALSREALAAAKQNKERADRILGWSSNRAKMELADRADLLQAEAALLSRTLELQTATDDEKAASRAFNTMRGLESEFVSETLSGFDERTLSTLKVPEKKGLRGDVRAAEQEQIAAQANAELARQRNKPVLDAFVNVGLNGRDTKSDDTVSESFTDKHPHTTFGVRFNIPLDLVQSSKNREAYTREALAAKMNYQQKVFEEQRLWLDLNKKFNDARQRLELAVRIEAAQKKKLEYERNRHSRGRTTTYQVILFEQDFSGAQLARIRAQTDVLNVFAQLKTFGGGR